MAKQPRILAGETVAITGAARGIGRATAEALTRQGMRVAIGDVDVETAQRTAAELGPTAVALALDVTDRGSFSSFLDEAERQLGPIDVLVNNAGIMQIGRFIDEDDTTARRMIDINLHGVILGTKLALERMIPRGRGHIVNVASQAGKFGTPGGATYSATKHAVVGLTEAVRGEMRLMGADINLSYVMPYVVKTELGSGLGQARGLSELEGRVGAERGPHHDRLVDAQVIHQRHYLLGVEGHRVAPHVARAIRGAVAEQVERDRAVAPRGEVFGQRPVHLLREQQTVDQDHRPRVSSRAARGSTAHAAGRQRRGAAAELGVCEPLPFELERRHARTLSV